jgi:elongation factor 1-beta
LILGGLELTSVLIISYTPSQADVAVFKALSQDLGYPNVARWYKHIKSYEAEFSTLSGSSSAGAVFTGEDDDIDLFGSDEEDSAEAEKIKAERVAAYNVKKANKPKTIAKVRDSTTSLTAHCTYAAARSRL